MFEMAGVEEELAREAFKLACCKTSYKNYILYRNKLCLKLQNNRFSRALRSEKFRAT